MDASRTERWDRPPAIKTVGLTAAAFVCLSLALLSVGSMSVSIMTAQGRFDHGPGSVVGGLSFTLALLFTVASIRLANSVRDTRWIPASLLTLIAITTLAAFL